MLYIVKIEQFLSRKMTNITKKKEKKKLQEIGRMVLKNYFHC